MDQEKWEKAGKNIQRIGCMMTALITIPILGLIIAGPIGLLLGFIIGILIFIAVRKKPKPGLEDPVNKQNSERQ